MTYDELLKHFGTQVGIAAALGIGQPAVSSWKRTVPPRYQYQVEVLTNGALRADPELRRPRTSDSAPAPAARP